MYYEQVLFLAAVFTTSTSFITGDAALHTHNITIWGSTEKNATSIGTLQYYLCGNGSHTLSSYTTLSLSSSAVHTITPVAGSFCLLQHLMNIVITSDDTSNPARIICDNLIQPATGFGFLNTTGLILCNLHIEQCGGILTHTAVSSINQSRVYFPMNQTAVLLFAVSSRLTLNNISITGMYYGYGIIICDCYNKITLNYITISSDSKSIKHYCSTNKHSWECAGSGLLLLYRLSLTQVAKVIIDVYNVHISDNSNHYPLENSPLDNLLSSKTRKVPLFGAGGITNIVLGSKVQIYYENCTIKQNSGNRGGGMLVIYTPAYAINDAFVMFTDVVFSSNKQTEEGNGAGLAMYIILDNNKSMDDILHTQQNVSCYICMYGSSFEANHNHKAVFGGGLYIGVKMIGNQLLNILLDTVGFISNTANSGGSALYIEEMPLTPLWKAYYVNVTIRNVYVNANGKKIKYFKPADELYFTDVAAMEFVRINTIHIEGKSIFEHNFGSAIKVSLANIFLSGTIRFGKNRGLKGGAICLQSHSSLIVSETANVLFIENVAYTYGGAIYTTNDDVDDDPCPFQFQNDNFDATSNSKQLTFINNTANKNGGAIYSIFLNNCPKFIKKLNLCNSKQFDKRFQLSSPPVKICFCKSNSSYINECSDHYSKKHIYPGTRITIGISALDYINHSVYTPIEASLVNIEGSLVLSGWNLGKHEEVQNAFENQCTPLKYTILKHTFEFPKARLHISILGEIPSIFIPLEVSNCPIGFQLCDRSGSCECHPFLNERKISSDCSINTTSITIPLNTWLGKVIVDKNTSTLLPFAPNINGTFGFAPVCPSGYCKPGITEINMTEQDSLCQHHRTGVLCGGCEDGYSLVLGPDECNICSNKYIWVIVVLLPLLSTFIVIMLFTLRLTIANSYFGGFIFYSNVTAITLTENSFSKISLTFLSLLNSDQTYGICFYNGLNAVIKTALGFVWPIYLWLIVVVIVIISKYSTCVANLTSHSSIQVLATLFYLSFAKLLLTAIDVFTPVIVQTPHGEYAVWYIDGNIPYWSKNHMALFITAVGMTMFYLFPFFVFTAFGSLILQCKSPLREYVRPFIDAYQGPYKDKWRWWFGARVCLLLYMYAIYSHFRGANPILSLYLHLIILIPFTIVHAYVRPLRSSAANSLEMFLLISLILLYVTQLYFRPTIYASAGWQYTEGLVCLVMIVFLGMICYHCAKCFMRLKWFRKAFPKLHLLNLLLYLNRKGYQAIKEEDTCTDAKLRVPLTENSK